MFVVSSFWCSSAPIAISCLAPSPFDHSNIPLLPLSEVDPPPQVHFRSWNFPLHLFNHITDHMVRKIACQSTHSRQNQVNGSPHAPSKNLPKIPRASQITLPQVCHMSASITTTSAQCHILIMPHHHYCQSAHATIDLHWLAQTDHLGYQFSLCIALYHSVFHVDSNFGIFFSIWNSQVIHIGP